MTTKQAIEELSKDEGLVGLCALMAIDKNDYTDIIRYVSDQCKNLSIRTRMATKYGFEVIDTILKKTLVLIVE